MSDYIKREDAQKITAEWLSGYITDDERNVIEHIDVDLGELPTVDVVEVVRCKDCRFYTFKPQQTSRTTSVRRCNRSAIVCTKPDDYCSFGERGTT